MDASTAWLFSACTVFSYELSGSEEAVRLEVARVVKCLAGGGGGGDDDEAQCGRRRHCLLSLICTRKRGKGL